jgi:N-acetylneuraminate lyase
MIKKTEGLLAATFSTFDGYGNLDLSLVPLVVDRLIADGLKGVFIGGTNGEGLSLTIEERMAVAEAYIKAADKRLLIFVHVGHSSISEAKKLATHAQQAGADAISAVAAFYFKPSSAENLTACMAQIAAAAPELPFYYYHMPAATNVNINVVDFLRLAEGRIPNLAGVKYTANTLHEYQSCLRYGNGKFDILFGYDELLLPALSIGAKGAIGSTYSFAAPMYLNVISLFRKGRLGEAEAAHFECVQMIRALAKYSPIPAQKQILKMLGLNLGATRLPLVELDGDECEGLKLFLDSVNFFPNLEKAKTILKQRVLIDQ